MMVSIYIAIITNFLYYKFSDDPEDKQSIQNRSGARHHVTEKEGIPGNHERVEGRGLRRQIGRFVKAFR